MRLESEAENTEEPFLDKLKSRKYFTIKTRALCLGHLRVIYGVFKVYYSTRKLKSISCRL
jgi:hypothetical protein